MQPLKHGALERDAVVQTWKDEGLELESSGGGLWRTDVEAWSSGALQACRSRVDMEA